MISGLSVHNQINKKPEKKEQNVQAFVRVRPFSQLEINQGLSAIPVQVAESGKEILCDFKGTTRQYKFDHVFGLDSIQSEVFNIAVRPICDEVLLGFNGTIFVYGQTGTGKTHTMEGRMDSPEQNGIIPRTIDYIFQCLEKAGSDYNIRASHLEIYKEEIFDLLACNGDTVGKPLGLFDTQKGFKIPDLEEIVVNDRHTILGILTKSCKRRQTAETQYNKQSSRSHCIFSITVHVKETTMNGEDLIKIGKLNLVDLAGSENAEKSGNNDRLREAALINKSLLTLGKVITDLSNNEKHIPYRSSQLTKILQDSLGGKTKTSIIATISPSLYNLEETVNTLEYALKAKSIKNTPQINQRMSKNSLLKEQSSEIARLKQLLQAAYDKNGVYLTIDMYESMKKEIEEKSDQITRSDFNIQAARHEISSMRKTFDEQTMLLEDAMNQLDSTKRQYNESKRIIEQMASQDSTLRDHLDDAVSDLGKLHDKVDNMKSTEQENYFNNSQSKEILQHHLEELDHSLQETLQLTQGQFLETLSQQLVEAQESQSKSNQILHKKFLSIIQLIDGSQSLIQDLSSKSSDSAQPLLKLNKDCNDVFTRIDKLVTNLRDSIKMLLHDFSPISFSTDHHQNIIANCLKLVNEHSSKSKDITQSQGAAIQKFSDSMSCWIQSQNQFVEQQKKFHQMFQDKLAQNKSIMEQKLISKISQVVSQFSNGYIDTFQTFQQTMVGNFDHLQKQTLAFNEDSKKAVMDLSSGVLTSSSLSNNLSQEINNCLSSNKTEQLNANLKVMENIEATKKKIETITDNCVDLCDKQKTYFNQFNDKFTDFTSELYKQKDVLGKVKNQKQHASDIIPLIEKSKDQFKNNMDVINKSLEVNKLNIQRSTNECSNHLRALISSIPEFFDSKVTVKTGQTPFKKQFDIPSPISIYNNNKENNNPLSKSQGYNSLFFDGTKSFGSSFLGNSTSNSNNTNNTNSINITHGNSNTSLQTPKKDQKILPQTPKSVKKTAMAPVTPKSTQKQVLFNTNQNSVSKTKISQDLKQQQKQDEINPLTQSKNGLKKSTVLSTTSSSSSSSSTSSSTTSSTSSSSSSSLSSSIAPSPFTSPKMLKNQYAQIQQLPNPQNNSNTFLTPNSNLLNLNTTIGGNPTINFNLLDDSEDDSDTDTRRKPKIPLSKGLRSRNTIASSSKKVGLTPNRKAGPIFCYSTSDKTMK
ncbi:hypothetical protein DICPUDRAFT_90705 [Dictyostelium purpureum]|uniref:Kinesin motor domain-containing protein n=1 Tax=Dictyostelium purpureum TaxID=5786 RepID=F1A494_DICPU|nr:uncharacterized protein DICPUDRAFT_90705 [Dictyostelium purpureum]EGC28989.1 hypothetical protein DICPUDRAFT_90705 [Dictyostelium purpureum]|eukprot:XP_003294486.1 hypothetical protein DICPUDRAFT_90705 [Dictyostelium purpureum]